MGTLRKHKALVGALSVAVMSAAALSLFFCEKKLIALENEWRALYALDELWGQATSAIRNKAPGLTRYNIEVRAARTREGAIEVRFCDAYSFFLFGGGWPSGVYRKTDRYPGEYASRASYHEGESSPGKGRDKARDLRLLLECDLAQKKVRIYQDGKFREEVGLEPGPVSYRVGLGIHRREATLQTLVISDGRGQRLFRADLVPWIFLKHLSQALLVLAGLAFLGVAGSQRSLFKRTLLFVFPCLFLEVFLRAAFPYQPDLNIHEMRPQWLFSVTSNFFGMFDLPGKFVMNSVGLGGKRVYFWANPEHAIRIVCIGSSPLAPTDSPAGQFFPAQLEKELNAQGGEKGVVMPLVQHLWGNLNSVAPNLFAKEVLTRWKPDLILYYGMLAHRTDKDSWEQIRREYGFYLRVKKILEENSDWIRNDRLLYAALEFKTPVKEVVYLYDFLCNSYLFMALESIRKRIFNEIFLNPVEVPAGNPEALFEEVLAFCKNNGIRVVFVPLFDFVGHRNSRRTEGALADIRRSHPEIYVLSLEGLLDKYPDFLLATDHSHPTLYGHEVIGKELFRQLKEIGLLDTSRAVQ